MDLKVKIRKFRAGDERAVARIIREATKITNEYYSPAVIKYLCANATAGKILEKAKKKNFRVAKLGGKIVGVIGLTENRIRQFFVDPLYQGKGVGRALLEYIESVAQKSKYSNFEVHSTLYAVPFYKHFGYKRIKKHKFTEKKGVVFETVLMKKILSDT